MLDKGGESEILDETAVADRSTEALQMGLEASNWSRTDLLARMSHEMRTPLSAILGFAQLLQSGRPFPTDSQKRTIDRILEAGWYLERLIDMTRDLALLEAGKLSLSLEPVPLAAAMVDVEAMIASQAQMRGIRLTFPVLESACSVSADRIRLQEVLVNLVSAAIDRSEAGGMVAVNCETNSSERVVISIDGGEGSSAARRTQSSQPSDSRGQQSAAVDGTGIGLVLARHLVGLMGGTIGAESVDGARKVFASLDLKRAFVPKATVRTPTHDHAHRRC